MFFKYSICGSWHFLLYCSSCPPPPNFCRPPFPACFAGPEAPAAPCPVQHPAVPLKTMKSAWLIIIIIGKRASCSVAMGTSDLWFCKCKQSLSIFREERRGWRRRGGESWTPALQIWFYHRKWATLSCSLCLRPSLLASSQWSRVGPLLLT